MKKKHNKILNHQTTINKYGKLNVGKKIPFDNSIPFRANVSLRTIMNEQSKTPSGIAGTTLDVSGCV